MKSAGVFCAPLLFDFSRSHRLSGELQHGRFLAFTEIGQQHIFPIRKLERIMVRMKYALVDLSKDRGFVTKCFLLLPKEANSIGDLQDIVRALRAKGAALRATEQPIDTSTAAGKCFLDMLGVFAEFETILRKERQREGIAKAKAEGRYTGRKPSINASAVRHCVQRALVRARFRGGWGLVERVFIGVRFARPLIQNKRAARIASALYQWYTQKPDSWGQAKGF
jgi:hypothetical protein